MPMKIRNAIAAAAILLLSLVNFSAQNLYAQGNPAAVSGLVFVEGGTFRMGVENSKDPGLAAHDVTVSSFYICDHEITVGEFRKYMQEFGIGTIADFDNSGQVYRNGKWVTDENANWENPGFPQTDDHPVTMVSWYDTLFYCNYLSIMEGLEPVYDILKTGEVQVNLNKNGYRLPTEAEWEYAARGGVRSKGNKYIGSINPEAVAWLEHNSGNTTHPVKKKMPNELGLYDMGGNVYEWCHDWFGPYKPEPVKDPVGPESGENKVLRGGSWASKPAETLPTSRIEGGYYFAGSDVGFRVVRPSGPGTSKPIIAKPSAPTVSSTTTTTVAKKLSSLKGMVQMTLVEGGTFIMGTESGESNEKPAHTVTVSTFLIGTYEITVAQFAKFIEVTGYVTEAEKGKGGWIRENGQWIQKSDANWFNPYIKQTAQHPVVHICVEDAMQFCNALSEAEGLQPVYRITASTISVDLSNNGYRLPTEAEWEFAARGGLKSKGCQYAGASDLSEVGWHSANSGGVTHPVGSKKPNELGIYDLSGNVWEWCQDRYSSYTADSQRDPLGWSEENKKVLRGGAWTTGPAYCRVYKRLSEKPDITDFTFGFRVARRP